MKIIIPMAGRGTRLRPHTLSTPKPLLPVAGKSIVQRLTEDIVELGKGAVDEIAFIIGKDFGQKVESDLLAISDELGAEGRIFYQEKPLGTAHAIWEAAECLEGETIIAFADTLFRADFTLDRSADAVIWVKEVANPSSFGVVTLDKKGLINGMVEKPTTFVSDLAIIGIYYMKDGRALKEEIRYLLENDIKGKGEYQLTDALENFRNKGAKLVPGKVADWMDCGNKGAVLDTNKKILSFDHGAGKKLVSDSLQNKNSILVQPCFIGESVVLENCVIGPFVSIGDNTMLQNCVISESIVQNNSSLKNIVAIDSLMGNHVKAENSPSVFDLGDYSSLS